MRTLDRVKLFVVRALVDVLVIACIGAAAVLVLWAFHGQQAYVVIQNTIAAQQAQQKGAQRVVPAPEPPK